MERPRDPFDLVIGLREDVVELRTTVANLSANFVDLKQDFRELKHDVRRLDDRIFQLMLLQVGTLATALASLVAALVS
jgi:hypothetical protein